jgi:translocation protein SEC62
MSTNEQQQKAPQEIRNVVNFLRSSKAGLKNRVGVLNGKRVDYFKGMMRLLSLLQYRRLCAFVTLYYGR